MKNKKRMSINLVASLVSFITSVLIGMVLTPYISKSLGDEAYGFIGIANNFVSYANILTVALNSMSSRFIAIEIHKGNNERANMYFNSVIIANVVMALILFVFSGIIVFNLQHLLQISSELVVDVKITFAIVFINFIISLLTSIYSIAPFVKNRLDLSSLRSIVGNLIRIVVIIPLFLFFSPKIYYVGISAMAMTLFVAIANYALSKRLMPEINIDVKKFKITAIKELLASGVWNSINQLSTALLTGIDLIIANIFISGAEAGLLSISKTIPVHVVTLLATIGAVFTPQFIKTYSQNDKEELVRQVKFSMKVMAITMSVPLAGFIIFGRSFYAVWLPYKTMEEITKIQILSVLTVLPNLFSCYIYTLYSINTVTNKLKVPVLVTLGLSLFSTAMVFVLLKTTSLGVYAIAGVSSVLLVIRILLFVPMYAAHNLHISLGTFYPTLFKGIGSCLILSGMFFIINKIVLVDSWFDLVRVAIVCAIIGYPLNALLILGKKEMISLMRKLKNKLRKGRFA